MTNNGRPTTTRPWATDTTEQTPPAPRVESAWPGDDVAAVMPRAMQDTPPTAPPVPAAAGPAGPDPVDPGRTGPVSIQGPRRRIGQPDRRAAPPSHLTGPGVPVAPRAAAPATPRRGEIGREVLFHPTERPPASGWRRVLHQLTGGSVNPGESVADVRRRELVDRVNQPIRGDYKIAVLSLKGGVGKTTTTVGLGSTFAALRGDHVVAADANPDRGTLAGRIPTQTVATVRDLLDDIDNIHRYSDVRAYTSQAPSRLEVLASERDPHRAEAFSETDYLGAVSVLEGFYNLILTDCGTGLTHSAMRGVLGAADALVLVSSPALDGAQSADATLTWLDAQGYHHLVERTVVVISVSRPGSSTVNLGQLVEHFQARVRAVQLIPFDPHLGEGSEVDLDRMSAATREAFVELAALVADDFPAAAGRHHGPQDLIR